MIIWFRNSLLMLPPSRKGIFGMCVLELYFAPWDVIVRHYPAGQPQPLHRCLLTKLCVNASPYFYIVNVFAVYACYVFRF